MNILVTGSNGQLGKQFQKLSGASSHAFFFNDKTELDICQIDQVSAFVKNQNIHLIINCAAYTAVDQAEEQKDTAFRVNHEAVKNLVEVCSQNRVALIHISTDYVFDGKHFRPYKETDTTNPLGVYGESKRAGEKLILNSEISALVIRTSWLYSSEGHNFFNTMLRLGKEREELNVVDDQIGTPTYALDLAQAVLVCVEMMSIWKTKRQIYHFSNEGVASWYDFTKAIFDFHQIKCRINPIPSERFPTKAERPFFSVLCKQKFKNDFNQDIRHWNDALQSIKK